MRLQLVWVFLCFPFKWNKCVMISLLIVSSVLYCSSCYVTCVAGRTIVLHNRFSYLHIYAARWADGRWFFFRCKSAQVRHCSVYFCFFLKLTLVNTVMVYLISCLSLSNWNLYNFIWKQNIIVSKTISKNYSTHHSTVGITFGVKYIEKKKNNT